MILKQVQTMLQTRSQNNPAEVAAESNLALLQSKLQLEDLIQSLSAPNLSLSPSNLPTDITIKENSKQLPLQINQIDSELIRIKRQISTISASVEPYNTTQQAGDTKVSLPPVFGAKKLMSPFNIKSLNLQKVANELEHPETEQNWIRLNELADNHKEKMGAGISTESK